MRLRFLVLLFFIISCSACATSKTQGLTEAISLKISGAYEGEANIDGEMMKVTLFDVKTDKLSTYKNVKPLAGGNRVPVYFDTDMEKEGAEYCALIYADEITFRFDNGAGWYNKEINTLPYEKRTDNLYFDLPLKYFGFKPFKAWTERSF